jgi:hypothetical protein
MRGSGFPMILCQGTLGTARWRRKLAGIASAVSLVMGAQWKDALRLPGGLTMEAIRSFGWSHANTPASEFPSGPMASTVPAPS